MHMKMDFEGVMTSCKADNTTRCRRSGGCSGSNMGGCSCERYADNIRMSNDCCESRKTWGLEGYPLASVYAPLQNFDNVLDKDMALSRGTIFSELDLPFLGASVYNGKGGNCRG